MTKRWLALAVLAGLMIAGCASPSGSGNQGASASVRRSISARPRPAHTAIQVPQTPQQSYVNQMNSDFLGYTSQLPDPSKNLNGTPAAILDNGAQICEALATGGIRAAAYDVSTGYVPGDGSKAETDAIVSFTRTVLCPKPSAYMSVYQRYVNALRSHGVYAIVARSDSNGDPYQFASIYICMDNGTGWTTDLSGSISQAQANVVARLTRKYLCPNQSIVTVVPTVTFIATGSNILYGPAGSENSGYSGMHLKENLPASLPAYYALSVTDGSCKLIIRNTDGSVSESTGSAPSGLATCELVSIGGQWYDANS